MPKTLFPKTISSLLSEYKSIDYLLHNESNKDDFANELELMKKEIINVLEELLSQYFSKDNIQEYIYRDKIDKNVINVSSYISNICFDIYNETPVVNNEMINKAELSAPIKRARDIVIETILNNDEGLIKSKTSAEATIYKAIVEKKHTQSISNILNIINEFIKKSDNNKISFSKLYNTLENKPYSIRKGIIPILLSMSLYNYSDIIIIYFMNKEIDLDAGNLIKINENPDKYFILTEKGTTDKIKYLSKLLYIFNIPNLDNQRVNLRKLVESMRRWILSLPRILREYRIEQDEMNISEKYISIKNELLRPDINNNEFIYSKLLEILETDDYEVVCSEIEKMKQTFDNFVSKYSVILIDKTKAIFDKNFKGSLHSLLKEWYKDNNLGSSPVIFDLKTKEIIDYINIMSTHDEFDIIEKISKIITGYYIEDWQPNEINNYENGLLNVIEKVKYIEKNDTNDANKIILISGNEKIEKYFNSSNDISAIGTTMKSNIEELIDEYGDSLTEEEKITVLLDIVKKYM